MLYLANAIAFVASSTATAVNLTFRFWDQADIRHIYQHVAEILRHGSTHFPILPHKIKPMFATLCSPSI
jgi:hypothetical protein